MSKRRTRPTRAMAPTPAPAKSFGADLGLAMDQVAPNPGKLSAFVLPKPMPGVLPSGNSTGMAMDGYVNQAYCFAAANSAFSEGQQAFPYQYLAELTQRAEYRRPSEILAKEMTRKWLKIQSTGDDDTDKQDKIKAIEDEFDRLNVQGVFKKAAEHDGFFGRAQIYIDVGVKPDDVEELKVELKPVPAKIGKGSLKCLTNIEPIWTYPHNYNSTEPLSPDFFKPQAWFVMGKEVHNSRLLTIISRPVPDLLKPAYSFGGLSLSQMAKPYVDNWLRTRQSVSDLLHSFSVSGLKTDLGDMLNVGAAEKLRRRMDMFNRTRDNRGIMVLDKNNEDFFNVSTPLSGLDSLQAQSQEHQSSVSGIPLSILLGITPSGLNASSDGEIRIFYQWVEGQQEACLTPPMRVVLQVVQLSLFGEIDPEITFKWEPLWSMDAKELAEVRKLEAETDAVLLQEGVITPQEVRERIANDEDSLYPALVLTLELPEPQADPAQEPNPLDEAPGGESLPESQQ